MSFHNINQNFANHGTYSLLLKHLKFKVCPQIKPILEAKFLFQPKGHFYLQEQREDVHNLGAQTELVLKETTLFCSARRK